MHSTASTRASRRAFLLATTLFLLCWPLGCGSGRDATAVRIGDHKITSGEVEHWISLLKARGSNGHEPGPPAPVPPDFTACIAYARSHPGPSSSSTPAIPKQPQAYCRFEYRRFKLKALYLLISHQWLRGEAAELHIRPNRPELARELSVYRKALGVTSAAAYKRYLRFSRADTADLLLSLQTEQLVRAIEAKVTATAKTPAQREAVLAQFGKAFKARWLAKTDCRPEYLVPLCRQYPPGRKPTPFVPPSVPLTDEPNGG